MAWYNLSAVGDRLVSRVVFNYADALALYPEDDGKFMSIHSRLLFSSSLADPEISGSSSRWGIILNPEKMTVINDNDDIKYGQDGSLYEDGTYGDCVQIAGGMMRINWSEPIYFWGFLNVKEYMNSGQYINRGNLGVAAELDELIMCYAEEPKELTIAENLERIKTAKESIRVAIENKGVAVDVNARIDTYSNYIDIIEVADADGSYNEGYNDGYTQGVEVGTSNAGEIIAQTAQVLNITKNGVYATKYTTPEDLGITDITGYFDDGTPFYGYAQLDGKAFMTDVIIQSDSKVEIWWRPDYNWTKKFYGDGLFSVLDSSQDFCVALRELSTGTQLEARINSTTKRYDTGIDDMWYHIMFSEEGLFINNYNVIESFNGAWISGKNLYLNICDRYNQLGSVNGYFGMIKVDGNIIIPTEDGFLNKTTGNMMDVYQEGGYKFTGVPEVEGNLIRTVNVNIPSKVNMQETGLKLAYSDITDVPDWLDWEGITDMSRMFSDCKKLIKLPDIDTSNVTTMSHMLYGATSITDIPKYDTSNVTNMSYMLYNATSITDIPKFDTSKVTDFNYFMYLVPIETFPELDTSSARNMSSMFYSCSKLTYIPALHGGNLTSITSLFGYSAQNQMTYFGGFKELKTKWDDNYGLKVLPNLTYESCISILENLYDFTGNGETPAYNQGKLKVHQNFLNLVGDDLAIGTNKGWTITV